MKSYPLVAFLIFYIFFNIIYDIIIDDIKPKKCYKIGNLIKPMKIIENMIEGGNIYGDF